MADQTSVQNSWIFQRNPKDFEWTSRENIAKVFGNTKGNVVELSEHVEPWKATRYFDNMKEGDLAFFWQSGSDGGLEGWGKIIEPAKQTNSGRRINVNTRVLLPTPINRKRVMRQRAMGRHALFKRGGAAGTNHRCNRAQTLELIELLEDENAPAPHAEFGEDVLTVYDLVEELELSRELTNDAEKLLNIAATLSKQKSKPQSTLNITTLFFAACEWGQRADAPRELQELSKKVEDLAGSTGYNNALAEYLGRTIAFDPGSITYLDGNAEFSRSLAGVLKVASSTHSTQIRVTLLMQNLLSVIEGGVSGGSLLETKLPQVVEATGQLMSVLISGTSAHVESDRWTTNDQLGYFDYACAFEAFLKNPKTKPPMTISIQAPWGGGKTSLMRMIQKLIDPNCPDFLIDNPISGRREGNQQALFEKHNAQSDRLSLRQAEEQIGQELEVTATDDPQVKSDSSNASVAQIGIGNDIPTIWFNAWTFQNHDQVWAGLGSSIIKGLSDRLEPLEREKFLFELNLKRVDKDALRSKIHRLILNKALEFVLRGKGLAVTAIAGLAGAFAESGVGYFGDLISGLDASLALALDPIHGAIGAGIGFLGSFLGKEMFEKSEPAEVKLDEFFSVPDYTSQKGFVSDVSEDLKKALALVPPYQGQEGPRPTVIFIDDLDRCSPAKIAEIFEAINLFLAGEFPNCFIVLGMDSEIVAASLQEAHKSVVKNLQSGSSSVSLGWRYMDKFVQLPFVVPSLSNKQVASYVEELCEEEVDDVANLATAASDSDETQDGKEAKPVVDKPSPAERREAINRLIEQQSRKAEDVLGALQKAERLFQHNPRALKRLANVFRFYMNLRAAREEQDEEVPSIEQMQNWVILMLRWPDFYRWLRSLSLQQLPNADVSSGSELVLQEIEDFEGGGFAAWQKHVAAIGHKDADTKSWFTDRALMEFFGTVGIEGDDGSLAQGAGKGFW